MTAIYLDHAASTPIASEVLDVMVSLERDCTGNPASTHSLGRRTRRVLEDAREAVAAAIHARRSEIAFTSGGTESNNLALRGAVLGRSRSATGTHVVASTVEHASVRTTLADLADRYGVEVTTVGVDHLGRVDPDQVLEAVRPDTSLVSVLLASNEVGTLQPIGEIGTRLRESSALFHTDAVQATAWCELDVDRLGVDLLSLSAHKAYGPKGIGALYVRDGTNLAPVLTGGGQEAGMRSGTPNAVGAAGFAAGLALVAAERSGVVPRVAGLRGRLAGGLAKMPGVSIAGDPASALPNIVCALVDRGRADVLLLGLDMEGICASSGSACASGRSEPSAVLTAMGVPPDLALGAVRFSLGRSTTDTEIDRVLAVLPGLLHGSDLR